MIMTTAGKIIMAQIKAQHEMELAESYQWIADGKILNPAEYPEHLSISQEMIDTYIEELAEKDEKLTLPILVHKIGKETNALYNGFPDDTVENRSNYARTLLELYKSRLAGN